MESELRDGYKMTELGALPEEWEVTKLGDICNIKMGQSPPSSSYNDNGNGLPFFQGNADFGTKFPTIKSYCNEPLKVADVDDILMSVRAPVGALNISNVRCCIGRGLTAINADKNNSQIFMYYLLQSCVGILNKFATGSTFTAINQKELNILLIVRPPLPEQRRIATILSTLDETVKHTEALIVKYKNIKAGLMADLLTRGIDEKGRIRSEENHRFKDSALGRVPEDWEVVKLRDTAKYFIDGDWIELPYIAKEGIRLIQTGNIGVGFFKNKEDKGKYISAQTFEDLKCHHVYPDDILICRLAEPIGRCCIIPDFESMYITAVDNTIYRIDEDIISKYFIVQYLNKTSTLLRIAKESGGSTRQRISRKNLENIPIPLPSLPEQRRIAEILAAADQRIEKEEAYRDKLLQLKKGLMQDLLTGKVRVKVPQKKIEV